MSERRTAEIKFRCTPTFKASLAAAADAADQTLTEFIESAVDYSVWAQEHLQDGRAGSGKARAVDVSDLRARLDDARPAQVSVAGDPEDVEWCNCIAWKRPAEECRKCVGAPPQPECRGNCRPWEFCACKADA